MQRGKSTLTFCLAPGGSISRATDVKHTFSSLGRGKNLLSVVLVTPEC